MNEDLLDLVLEKEKKRYRVLLALYRATKGKELVMVNLTEVAKQEGLEEDEVQDVFLYFRGEGLIGMRSAYNTNISLSHKAIVEIEQTIKNPKQSTEHFQSTVIQHLSSSSWCCSELK